MLSHSPFGTVSFSVDDTFEYFCMEDFESSGLEVLVVFFVFLITMLVSIILLALVLFLMPRLYDSGNASPLESGFYSFSGGSGIFSLQFFTLLIIYMVFDLEIVLFSFFVFTNISGLAFFLVVLFAVLTLLLEWLFGNLVWEF